MKKITTVFVFSCLLMGLLIERAAPDQAPSAVAAGPGGKMAPALFSDVPDSHWAAEKIRVLSKNNCIYGYADGTFLPERPLSRVELAAILVKVAGEKPLLPEKPSFNDVKRDQWFYSPVETAKKFFSSDHSLEKGVFRPDDLVTRQEAVGAIVLAKKLPIDMADPLLLQATFTDHEDISPAYRMRIAGAAGKKLIKGFPDRTFRPESPLTRAEAAALIYSAFFSDVSIAALMKNGTIQFFDKSSDEMTALADSLNGRFGNWEGVKMNFYVREIAVNGNKDDRLIMVIARVDPFKYFTFSDAIFKHDPASVREYAEKISAAVVRAHPNRRNIVMIGFSEVLFYDTVPEVYGREYTRYSPAEGGWRIERFYTGVMSQDGKIAETWMEPQASRPEISAASWTSWPWTSGPGRK